MGKNEWLDTKLGEDIWNNKYRYNNESLDEWLERVSGGDKELKQLIIDKKFLFGGRTLSNYNTGVKGASTSNCYSSGYAPDSLNGLLTLNKNIGLTYKAQGGQGLSLSKIRPKGCRLSSGHETDGIVPFMKLFNVTTESVSQGGCIDKDELVLTDKGYKKISSIQIGDKVWTKKGFIEVNYVFDKGVQKIYEVKTKKGYKIKTTIDHKFSIDGFKTKHLSELKIGDKVNIITKNTKNGEFKPLAYFLGYLNGNGYISKKENSGTLTMHWNQKDICNRLLNIINNDLGFNAYIGGAKENSFIRIYLNKDIIDYLKSINALKNKTENIEVPDFIMEGTDNDVISYISGALDSDGCVYETRFKYDTISKKYANQLLLLLNRVGFFPTMSVQKREGKADLYTIRDGFRINQPSLYSIKKDNVQSTYCSNSALSTPYTIKKLNLDRNLHGHLKKINENSNIGLYTYLNATHNTDKFSPMILDKIISIEPCGESHVYDISLVEEHLFDCNGFYVSNSRKGALMMSLDAWHKEADTFIKIKSEEGQIQGANLSLEFDDEFMECIKEYYKSGIAKTVIRTFVYDTGIINYEVTPIKIYKEFCKKAYDWAEPGAIYTNRFRNYNLMQYVKGYDIVTGNPCLHPDTLVHTTEGEIKIKDMKKPMKVYCMDENGKLTIGQSSPSFITKKNTRVLEITVGDRVLKLTDNHLVYVKNKGWIETENLCIGDVLIRVDGKELKSDKQSTIDKIELGEITDVYDITVDKYHNFVAEGVIVHNCGK